MSKKTTKVGKFTITDLSEVDQQGNPKGHFTVRWENNIQNFKSMEEAKAFCDNYGTINKAPRAIRRDE
jgi:hypothetical protein